MAHGTAWTERTRLPCRALGRTGGAGEAALVGCVAAGEDRAAAARARWELEGTAADAALLWATKRGELARTGRQAAM